jgi:transposase-like protein
MKLSRKYGVARTSIRDWISLYKHHGIDGLIPKNERYYDGQFKIDVIEYMENNHLSICETAAIFCIPSSLTVLEWKRKYYEKGKDAFLKLDKSKEQMTNKKELNSVKAPEETDKDLISENRNLKAKNHYLQIENDYLKKLNELIQEKGKIVKKKR